MIFESQICQVLDSSGDSTYVFCITMESLVWIADEGWYKLGDAFGEVTQYGGGGSRSLFPT